MISLVRWKPGAVKEAISLCNGLEKLHAGSRVLIKPNIALGGAILLEYPGMYTQSSVIEEILKLLHDHGVRDITIGEGSVLIPGLSSTTQTAFYGAGYSRFKVFYQVKFVDFNQSEYVPHDFEGTQISVAKNACEYDFFINVPVLKTHMQTGVSLGMKNLKGILRLKSKQDFHKNGLHRLIAALNRIVKSDLVVIDGRFAMERGPMSKMVKKANLILSGTDVFEVDRAGSRILGIDPKLVGHLMHYALMTGRSMDEPIDVRGESIEAMTVPCEWRREELADPYALYGITGVRLPIDNLDSVCSMCSYALEYALFSFSRSMKCYDYRLMEFVMGCNTSRFTECRKTVLFGNCAIDANADRSGKILIKGCPPSYKDLIDTLKKMEGGEK